MATMPSLIPHAVPLRGEVCVPSLWTWVSLWLLQQWGKATWFPRLGYRRWDNFHVALWGCLCSERSRHAVRKPNLVQGDGTERPHVVVLAGSPTEVPAVCQHHLPDGWVKTLQMILASSCWVTPSYWVFPEEAPDTMKLTYPLCPAPILYLQSLIIR